MTADGKVYQDQPVDKKEWRELLTVLRVKAPCALPVKVYRCKTSADIWGDTTYSAKPTPHFKIRINRTLGKDFAVATLIHEWAHALAHVPEAWTVSRKVVNDHGPEWGIAFAKSYCVATDCD